MTIPWNHCLKNSQDVKFVRIMQARRRVTSRWRHRQGGVACRVARIGAFLDLHAVREPVAVRVLRRQRAHSAFVSPRSEIGGAIAIQRRADITLAADEHRVTVVAVVLVPRRAAVERVLHIAALMARRALIGRRPLRIRVRGQHRPDVSIASVPLVRGMDGHDRGRDAGQHADR